MRAEVPGGGAAHAEAADQGAVLIDGVLALDGVEGFEEIDLAGEAVGVAEAAVEVEHDGVARREFAGDCWRAVRKLTSLRASSRPWNQASTRQRCGAVGE